jgi:hypothetical protein
MEEFGLKRRDVRSFEIWLPICLQMELGVYPTPVPEDPSTHEDEHREYIVEDYELDAWIKQGRKQAEIYFTSVLNTQAMERMGVTYGEMTRISSDAELPDSLPGDTELYEADEDLMFLYERLGILHRFMFEAKVEMDHGGEHPPVSFEEVQLPGDDSVPGKFDLSEHIEQTKLDYEEAFGSPGEPPF